MHCSDSADRWEGAGGRAECLPDALGGRFGVVGLDLLAGRYKRLGLTWREARCFAWALWRAGDDLRHAVSKKGLASDAGINRRGVQATFKRLVAGGLLRERPPAQVRQPPGRKGKGGCGSVGYWFPRYADMGRAVELYLRTLPRRAAAARATMRLYRWADRRGGRKAEGPGPRIPCTEQGCAYPPQQGCASPAQTSLGDSDLTDVIKRRARGDRDSSKTVAELLARVGVCPAGDAGNRRTVAQMLSSIGVSPNRAAKLAALPKATPELVDAIIQKCRGRSMRNPGAYVATALANAVESRADRAVREAKRAIRGVSQTVKEQKIAQLRAADAGRRALAQKELEAIAADLNGAPPVEIAGVRVGRGAAYAWAQQGHLLIFENRDANDGRAFFAFEHGQRDVGRLPGILAVIPAPDIPPPQAHRTG